MKSIVFLRRLLKSKYILPVLLIFITLFYINIQSFHISLNYISSEKGTATVYYGKSNSAYNETNIISRTLADGGKNTSLDFYVPYSNEMSLRLDLDNISNVSINSVCIYQMGVIIKCINLSELSIVNDAKIEFKDSLTFSTTGSDPFVELGTFSFFLTQMLATIFSLFFSILVVFIFRIIQKLSKRDLYSIFIILIFFTIIMVMIFSPLFKGMKISPTNILYNIDPWKDYSVITSGPLLSDPSDVLYPKLYQFMNNGFRYWSNLNVFGYPVNPLAYVFNYANWCKIIFSEYGFTIITLLKHCLAFFGMLCFMKDLHVTNTSAFLSATTFALSSSMVMWGQWDHTAVISLAPWLFFFLNRFIDKHKISYAIFSIITLFFMFSANMVAYVAYYVYLIGLYVLFKIYEFRKDKKKVISIIIGFSVIIIVSVLLSAFLLTDLFELIIKNGNVESRKESMDITLSLRCLAQFFAPFVSVEGFHINEIEVYCGIAILLLPYSVLFNYKNKYLFFWQIIIFIILILLFTHLLDIPFSFLPIMNSSYKTRIITLLNFSVSVLIGYVCTYIQSETFRLRAGSAYIYLIVSILLIVYYIKNIGLDSVEYKLNFFLLICGLLILLLLIIFKQIKYLFLRNLLIGCFVLLNVIGLCNFTKQYIPYISLDASNIPESEHSETLSFLIENSDVNTRITSLGTWNFPANTNVYYGLKNIRGHDFAVTNMQVQKYMKKIDKNSYVTNTFTSLTENLNLNLLKYASVKYLIREDYKGFKSIANLGLDYGNYEDILIGTGEVVKGISIIGNNLNGIVINISQGSDILYEVKLSESDINGNIANVEIPNGLFLEKNKSYNLNFNNQIGDNSSLAYMITDSKFIMKDNCLIEEIEANNRFFLSRKVFVYENEDKLLEYMSNRFVQNSVHILENEKNATVMEDDLDQTEVISNVIDNQDAIEMSVNINQPTWLVVSNQYDENWKAYVNGNEVDIQNVNSLFQGIYLEHAGVFKIEILYSNPNVTCYIMLSFLGAFILMLIIVKYKIIETKLIRFLKD